MFGWVSEKGLTQGPRRTESLRVEERIDDKRLTFWVFLMKFMVVFS